MADGILAGAVAGILFLFAVGFVVGILIVSVIGHRRNDGWDRDDDGR